MSGERAPFQSVCRSAGAAFALAAFAILVIFQIASREPIFHDELYNLARTEIGFANLAQNILDYSLRPLYRVLNQGLRELFGPTLNGMWLGGLMFTIAAAALLQAVTALRGSGAAVVAAPFFLLAMPLLLKVGLAGMPQLPSGVFALGSLFFVVRWCQSFLEDRQGARDATIDVAAATVFGTCALLTHPGQLAYVFAMFAILGLVVALSFVREAFTVGPRTQRALRDAVIAAAIFIALIAVVEIIFRITVYDFKSPRLLPGHGYTYLNLWIGNVSAFDGALSTYKRPMSFYLLYLADYHALFAVMTLLLTIVAGALGVLSWRKSDFKSGDLVVFVPIVLFGLWLVVSSLSKMKTGYNLVGGLPLAVASNALLFGYILQRSVSLTRYAGAVGAALVVALATWVAVDYRQQRQNLELEMRKGAKTLGESYRLFSALPKGPVGMLRVTDGASSPRLEAQQATAAERKLQRGCRTLAGATQRPLQVVHVQSPITPEVAAAIRSKLSFLCLTPGALNASGALAEDLRAVLKFTKIYTSPAGNEIWVPVRP